MKYFLLVIFIISHFFCSAQNSNIVYSDTIFFSNIKTVNLHKQGWELSYPVLELGNTPLLLSFDDLNDEESDYSYKLIHCKSNWESSGLYYYDYQDGYEENNIRNFNYSINTTINYTNYSLQIPNEDVTIKISGNYIISVFKNDETKQEVLRKRFYVIDHKVTINAKVKQPAVYERRKNSHQINFTINTQSLKISDPYADINVLILQNGRYDNKIDGFKPIFVKDKELIYDYDEGNIFYANNEFRYFNTKYLTFNSERIKSINYNKTYKVDLLEDESENFKKYFFHKDMNGKYIIQAKESEESYIEADYVFVTFCLKQNIPLAGADVYIYSNINNYALTKNNKMTYNFNTHKYYCTLLLKQGFYNYSYAYVDKNTVDVGHFEGNHYETENDYIILVYYKDFTFKYEKLIGYQIVNSSKINQ